MTAYRPGNDDLHHHTNHWPFGDDPARECRLVGNTGGGVALGIRVHGGFGTFIPIGIRIGEDALHRLGVGRRDVSVVYSSGPDAPCPCVADGIAIATEASAGQGTLQVTAEKSAPGTLGVVVIRDKKTGNGFRYTIPASTLPQLMQWNKSLDPLGRYNAVMDAPEPFSVIKVAADH